MAAEAVTGQVICSAASHMMDVAASVAASAMGYSAVMGDMANMVMENGVVVPNVVRADAVANAFPATNCG